MVDTNTPNYSAKPFKCDKCGKALRVTFEDGNTGGWAELKTTVNCLHCYREFVVRLPGKYLSVEKWPNCSDCDKPATQMFHFRNERAGLDEFRHVPRCELHSLRDHPQAAACFCKGNWQQLMERERG